MSLAQTIGPQASFIAHCVGQLLDFYAVCQVAALVTCDVTETRWRRAALVISKQTTCVV